MSNARAARMAERTRKHEEAAARVMDGFVRTPAGLADDLVSGHRDMGAFTRGARILEPSAGDGAIVRAILECDRDVTVIAVEPNGKRADALDALAGEAKHAGRVIVFRGTLEQYAEHVAWCREHPTAEVAGLPATMHGDPFDGVIMNPPFGDSSRDLVWIDHVRTAWGMLRDGALLASIVPPSYATSGFRAQRDFRTWAESNGATYAKLPGQPFAESGTGTQAGVLTVPRPMPARADGLPTWLYAPAAGVPVPVRGLPVTTSAGALTMPVQEYSDFADGSRPRVLRYSGTCHACGRCCWSHDDRHDAAAFEATTVDAAEHAAAGPSVVLCLEHGTGGEETAAALAAVAPHWTPDADADADPLADAGPIVYPFDLDAGTWATVRGADARGWVFTITGRVMCTPERVADLGDAVAFRFGRVGVTLRTVRGWTVELYALEDQRVTVRDVLADAVPAPAAEPLPDWMPQPAAGRPLATAGSAERLAESAAMAAHHQAAADTARAHVVGGSTVVARTTYGAPVIVAQARRIDITDDNPPAGAWVADPAATPVGATVTVYGIRSGQDDEMVRRERVTLDYDTAAEAQELADEIAAREPLAPGMAVRVLVSRDSVNHEYATADRPAPVIEPAAVFVSAWSSWTQPALI
jgi:predicted RNA methylase